ncbi:hypothetical protein VE00_00853 [Pseudogymnoascus sp. WSF 3629]|nr:hypothetical protein VE00_00853 [Pseudogymnoascus sp. WSF 3629]
MESSDPRSAPTTAPTALMRNNNNIPDSAPPPPPLLAANTPPTPDQSTARPLKRSRIDSSPNSATVGAIADAGLTASPLAKSPRFGTSVSPRASPGAAAIDDERERERLRRSEAAKAAASGKAPGENNPGHKVISALISGSGGRGRQDAPAATTTMSEGMEVAANAISIPSPLHFEDKSQNSPASVTSLGSMASTAQTATASTTGITSPSNMMNNPGEGGDHHRDNGANGGGEPQTDKPSARAFTFPGNALARSEGLRDPVRGLSLPMSGLNQHLAPRSPSHKKHKCPYCDTEFTRHHNLKSHLLTHSQEKPYVCNTCQMRFRRLHDLKRHSKLHTGERPHICPKCDRKFARGDALARHAKGQGGCAGRRASMGSFGGDEEYDDSHLGEDGSGMEGVLIKAQHVDAGAGGQDPYAPLMRGAPSTYPPPGPRRGQSGPTPFQHLAQGELGSGSTAGSGGQSSVGGVSSHTTMSTAPSTGSVAGGNNGGNNNPMLFAQTPMTESPKPISPGAMSSLQLGHDPASVAALGRQRSPSLATQVQQRDFGRRQQQGGERMGSTSSQGMGGGPKLPALSGLAPPEARFMVPSQAGANGTSTSTSTSSTAFRGGLQQQQQGGPDSSNNLFSSERGVWTYVQSLEEKVDRLTERVVGMEGVERRQEERIRKLVEEDTLDWTDYFVGLTGELGGAPYEVRAPTEYTTASPPTPESRTRPRSRKPARTAEPRKTKDRVMTTMEVENGIPAVVEPARQEVREEGEVLVKRVEDAVVDGGEGVNGRGEGEVNGKEEGETVLPKSFAEVVVEGAKEGAYEGERTATNGDKKGHTDERNGDKKDQRNGDKKVRRDKTDDGDKSYAALLQPPKPTTPRPRRSKPSHRPPSHHHTHSAELYEDTEFEDSDIFTNYPSNPSPSHSTEHLVSIKPRSGASSPAPPDDEPNRSPGLTRTLTSGREAGKNWHASRIRFAPLNIPLQRRLQTATVLAHTLCIAMLIGTFLFACAIPLLWPLIVPYMVYVMFSKAGYSGELSMRSPRLRGSKLWSLFAGYFPARLHRTVELSPTRKYIFGYHPHGIISHGAFAAFATEALGFAQLFPGITNSLLTLDSNFRIPFYREYILALGLASVSRQSCENVLSKGGVNGEGMGRAITIVVGGARESLDARPGTLRLVLRRRYGFVKMALRTGADLVPVLGFGENELYDQFSVENRPWIRRGQDLLKRTLGWTLPLFHARGVFNYDVGLVPYRRAVNVVVGRPIEVRMNRMPSVEEVEEVHERYCEELVRLWETWKDDFAQGRAEEMKIGD